MTAREGILRIAAAAGIVGLLYFASYGPVMAYEITKEKVWYRARPMPHFAIYDPLVAVIKPFPFLESAVREYPYLCYRVYLHF